MGTQHSPVRRVWHSPLDYPKLVAEYKWSYSEIIARSRI